MQRKATVSLLSGTVSPPYLEKHSGPVLVAGNAWCLHDDLERARDIYPRAPVIGVNGASREIEVFALYSGHPDQFITRSWIANQKRLFHDDFTVHSSTLDLGLRERCAWVDHWWDGAQGGRGTSAWGARKLAHFMGFDLVILCGAPLVPGPYAGYRLGGQMAKPKAMQRYCKIVKAETEWHKGALSMSGYTAKILGSPT